MVSVPAPATSVVAESPEPVSGPGDGALGTMWGAKGEMGPPVTKAGVGPPASAPSGPSGGAQRRALRRFLQPRAATISTSATAYAAMRYTTSHQIGSTRVL